jgi:hypothetical protein
MVGVLPSPSSSRGQGPRVGAMAGGHQWDGEGARYPLAGRRSSRRCDANRSSLPHAVSSSHRRSNLLPRGVNLLPVSRRRMRGRGRRKRERQVPTAGPISSACSGAEAWRPESHHRPFCLHSQRASSCGRRSQSCCRRGRRHGDRGPLSR